MSYTSIPNQPIVFNTVLSEPCPNCNTDYNQYIDFDDQLFFQLEAGQCGNVEFDSELLQGTWTQSGSTISSTGGSGGYIQYYRRFDVVQNVLLTVTVTDITGILDVVLVGGGILSITAPGTHQIYLSTANTTSNLLVLSLFSGASPFNGSFTIDSVVPVPNGGLFVGLVDPVTLAVVERFDPVLTTSDQYLTAAINLADVAIEPGCYRLAIADYCTNTCGQYYVYNPYFNGDPMCIACEPIGWTSDYSVGTDDWDVGNGLATIDYSVAGNITYLESITELCEDVEYSITIVVDSINDGTLRFVVDQVTDGPLITSAGTYTFNVTPSGPGKLGLVLLCDFGLRANVEVSLLTARAYKEHAIYDKYTDEVNIGDYSDECKYFKIEGCNAENQFGLAFNGTSFLPGIRLQGRKFRAQYVVDSDIFRYASGRTVTPYADIVKKWTFYFERMPEYVLDFLSIVFFFDNVYINGDVYAPAENTFPDIEYNDADNLGSITIDLIKKNTLVRKTVCVAADANCLPSILDLDTEPFILAQDGDRLLTQNNINLYQQ